MKYIMLFLVFFKIGAVSFGGGYGMISLIREECVNNNWLTEEEVLNFIAVSESTPGPLAVNMATFIGSSQGGIFGAILATFGVILPAFIIILLIAILIKNLLKYECVKKILNTIRPIIIALILATSIIMLLKVLGLNKIFLEESSTIYFDWRVPVILLLIISLSLVFEKITKKKLSPIIMILVSAFLGILFYGILI